MVAALKDLLGEGKMKAISLINRFQRQTDRTKACSLPPALAVWPTQAAYHCALSTVGTPR